MCVANAVMKVNKELGGVAEPKATFCSRGRVCGEVMKTLKEEVFGAFKGCIGESADFVVSKVKDR